MSKRLTTKEFIERSLSIHGNKYDYSKVDYVNSSTKVCIICPEHGEFWQSPDKHLTGRGCPRCAGRVKDKSDIIEKFKKIHGDKYDYSKVEYISNHTKVCIICPEHGEFWQQPANHLSGEKCPKCSKRYMDTEYFVQKAREKHGNEYDYSKTVYKKNKEKVVITCKIHGDFLQDPNSHLQGCGCSKCYGRLKKDNESFISKAKLVHKNKYDYSKVDYVNHITKVCIVCPEHGEFWQTPREHLDGCGCQVCGKISRLNKRRVSPDYFLERAKKVHGNKYFYKDIIFKNEKEKIKIICPEHGEFEQTVDSHLRGNGCPICGNSLSKAENEIYQYVCDKIGKSNVIKRERSIIKPEEIDIYIPFKKIGIEYNGLIWHSEKFGKIGTHHLGKTERCKQNGIHLIQIFEDEYVKHKEIVLSKINHLLDTEKDKEKIYGRKCEVKEITYNEAKAFLRKNHIQGWAPSSVYLGSFYNNSLVGVMSFKDTGKTDEWELNRCATDINYVCCGVSSKLFKNFVRKWKPKTIKSFADRRWTINEEDNLYIKLGFVKSGYTKPDYRYYSPKKGLNRVHKFNFRKQTLHKKYGLPMEMTEKDMVDYLGFYRIWDCGLIKYVWNNPGA